MNVTKLHQKELRLSNDTSDFFVHRYRRRGEFAMSTSTDSASPSDFLKAIRGQPVLVRLSNGVDYKGVLACLDGYMNVAMEQAEEHVDGQLRSSYGDCFIRGNNGSLFLYLLFCFQQNDGMSNVWKCYFAQCSTSPLSRLDDAHHFTGVLCAW